MQLIQSIGRGAVASKRLFPLAVVGVLLAALPADAQRSSKGSGADIQKARDAVKKLSGDLNRLTDQLGEARKKLAEAEEKLKQLEGRSSDRRFGRGGFRGFNPDDVREFMERMAKERPEWREFMERMAKERPEIREFMERMRERGFGPPKGGFPGKDGKGGFRGFPGKDGKGGFRGFPSKGRPPFPPRGSKSKDSGASDLEKRLDNLMKELEALRNDIRRSAPRK